MSLLYTTHDVLDDFRRKNALNEIYQFKKEVIEDLQKRLSIDIDENILELDYATPELKIPKEYIPFRFLFKPNTQIIDEYLQNHIIFVSWKNKK